ncbi:MAG TPA: ribose 5-phosphate isomerase B [Ignavibacteriales bacterium]|nr:ribose 5-phosphate isomerase B [Ignavibacteriales bacterium]HOL81832.1 ribose 5-phosphate isomerase B [Ignavibacteriales bacterium]HOM65792.1 ribose 5-phosphate isomerase B [Ignavibacteriales bacterium]HPD67105.1 ribose 5-phosphate isomerase B [Ignavibacteriales bacterium]HPP33969.1 ribose 5-phosphate isomerase B [Ignavibacteriales bacterium]
MKIAIASDHGGFLYKEKIKSHLANKGINVFDFGTFNTESCDYPDYIKKAAEALSNKEVDFAIGVCSSGIGVSIVANKIKGVRAALCHNIEIAKLSRQHNNANFLALGQKFVDENILLELVDTWLNTEFEGGRHQRRVEKIEQLNQ